MGMERQGVDMHRPERLTDENLVFETGTSGTSSPLPVLTK
jgi:hypothetical protein